MITRKSKHQNPNKIRVLCINLEGNIAGAEQSLLLLVRFIPKTTEISVACPTGILSDKLKNLGIKTYKIMSTPTKLNFMFAWLFYLAFVSLQLTVIVFKTKPHIIHANNSKAMLVAILPKIFWGRKLICHVRDAKCSKFLAVIYSSVSTGIIAVSNNTKNVMIKAGVRPELVTVIYNGVVVNEKPRDKKRRNCNDSMVFANIGQFVPWKKQCLFIEAAEDFLQEGYNGQFILIGNDIFGRDGKYKKHLKDRIKASPFASKIKLSGWQNDMGTYWPKIDCLIHTADKEPFGRVIIEAMIHGIPVIAAASHGPAEIITHGKTGFLFRPDNTTDLIGAMKTVSGNTKFVYGLVENARQYVALNFQAKQTAEKINQAYKNILAA